VVVLVIFVGPPLIAYLAEAILSAFGIPTVMLMLILFGPGIIAGIGLLNRRPWARILALLMAILDLMVVPIGTAIGIYTIWVLVKAKEAGLLIRGVSSSGQSFPAADDAVARAYRRLRIPSIGLIIAGAINCSVSLLACIVAIVSHGIVVPELAITAAVFGLGLLIIAGACHAMRLRSYGLAVAGTVFATLPCSPGGLVSLPMGIWALLILSSAEVHTAFVAKENRPADAEKLDSFIFVMGIVGIVVVMLSVIVPVRLILMFSTGSRQFHHPGPLIIRSDTSNQNSPTSAQKIGHWDFPYGTWDHIEFSPAGPTLTEQCVQTMDLKSSEQLAVNNILQKAHQRYLELEDTHTPKQSSDNHIEVTIAPFRERALPILEQLWNDLDAVLDTQKQEIARRHLPFGRLFGTFQFGEPTVTVTISKQGGTFLYGTKYEWPEGNGKSGGGTSGGGPSLPPEYQRFWDEAQINK